jgi:hypothetical protein
MFAKAGSYCIRQTSAIEGDVENQLFGKDLSALILNIWK